MVGINLIILIQWFAYDILSYTGVITWVFSLVGPENWWLTTGLSAGLLSLPFAVSISMVGAYSLNNRLLLSRKLQGFSVSTAECSDPADRVLLRELIGQWFALDLLASDEKAEGIRRFEEMVRSDLRRQVEGHIGGDHQVISYSALFTANILNLWRALDYIIAARWATEYGASDDAAASDYWAHS